MKRIGLLFLLLVVIGVSLWLIIGKRKAPGTNVVTIGVVLPLTGDVASYGLDSRDGINLAVDSVNAAQDKYQFRVVIEDSKGDPKTAVSALEKLLSFDKPVALLGENLSSSTMAMIPVINRQRIVLMSPSASTPKLTGASRFFFRTFPSDDEEGEFIANVVAREKPHARVCILYVNNDYGLGIKDVFTKKASDLGIQVLDAFGYDASTNDFKAVLARIKKLVLCCR